MILGVVLAGGQSRRFGGDKALAILGGETLIERTVNELAKFCDGVVVAGRSEAPVETTPDWPDKNMGPLGGIAGGLRYAAEHGYHSVLTCGVDSVDLPNDLLRLLNKPPAFFSSQPVIGHWPVATREAIEDILLRGGRHSMRAFAASIDAREVNVRDQPANINTKADLVALRARFDV